MKKNLQEHIECVKLQKRTARNLYNLGVDITLHPCKLRSGVADYTVNNSSGRDFDALINEYEFYNCNLNETGKYAAYYVDIPYKTDVDRFGRTTYDVGHGVLYLTLDYALERWLEVKKKIVK